jgi:S-adenosylmethionine hydrolase
MSDQPWVTFLSDYGLEDDFVGICHGVIARLCPQARVIDLTHGVARHDVRAGALALRDAMAYVPAGVMLAVVDPDVGAERRAVALRASGGGLFVGPDNGLLMPAVQRAGGVLEAVDVARSPFRLEPVSATFHGRDIFAPVAARLAAGEPLAAIGDPVDPRDLVGLDLPRPFRDGGTLIAHVLHVDRFGNLALDAGHEDLQGSGLRLGHPVAVTPAGGEEGRLQFVRTFADVPPGELLLYEDAQRRLALAVSHGDASARLGLKVDDELRIRAP